MYGFGDRIGEAASINKCLNVRTIREACQIALSALRVRTMRLKMVPRNRNARQALLKALPGKGLIFYERTTP